MDAVCTPPPSKSLRQSERIVLTDKTDVMDYVLKDKFNDMPQYGDEIWSKKTLIAVLARIEREALNAAAT